jgi:hypothetical protein
VVARHAEEALANSNRALLAHLGTPASLLALSRAYRTPNWPGRLLRAMPAEQPVPVLLPERPASFATRPEAPVHIGEKHIARLAQEVPRLWQGADVWHIPMLPSHYKAIALASQRGGIVVSEVTTVVADDLPRAPLAGRTEPLFPADSVKLELRRDAEGQPVRLVVRHPLVSHAQLTTAAASIWIEGAKKDDVDQWPDPDCVYVISRCLKRGEGPVEMQEEDADVSLVAWGDANAPSAPIVARALGTRYGVAAGPAVFTTVDGDTRTFFMETALVPKAPAVESEHAGKGEYGTAAQIEAFNALAAFAAILTPHQLRIDFAPQDAESAQVYLARLQALPAALLTSVQAIEDALATQPFRWNSGAVVAAMRGRIAGLQFRIAALSATNHTAATLRDAAGFPVAVTGPWLKEKELPKLSAAGADVSPWEPMQKLDDAPGTSLVVWDLATQQEIDAIRAADVPPLAKQRGGRLYRMLARRILGGANAFSLRVVDGRARIGAGQLAPGVVDVRVQLPGWLEEEVTA